MKANVLVADGAFPMLREVGRLSDASRCDSLREALAISWRASATNSNCHRSFRPSARAVLAKITVHRSGRLRATRRWRLRSDTFETKVNSRRTIKPTQVRAGRLVRPIRPLAVSSEVGKTTRLSAQTKDPCPILGRVFAGPWRAPSGLLLTGNAARALFADSLL